MDGKSSNMKLCCKQPYFGELYKKQTLLLLGVA